MSFKLPWNRTAEEKQKRIENKKRAAAAENAGYLGRKLALDPSDINRFYEGNPDDMKHHAYAYSADNCKLFFGVIAGSAGIADLLNNISSSAVINDMDSATEVISSNENTNSTHGFEIALAVGGAFLVASGLKGKKALANTIRSNIEKLKAKEQVNPPTNLAEQKVSSESVAPSV
jgi:hypothetical protein